MLVNIPKKKNKEKKEVGMEVAVVWCVSLVSFIFFWLDGLIKILCVCVCGVFVYECKERKRNENIYINIFVCDPG